MTARRYVPPAKKPWTGSLPEPKSQKRPPPKTVKTRGQAPYAYGALLKAVAQNRGSK